jgi:two-component system, chemotaxis family, CheB/CheR fusion protein
VASEKCIPIVGVGASAGGLEALSGLLRAMPDDPGMAFVIVTHLAHGRESLLSEILARYTRMPVMEAIDGRELEANHVYVLQPDALLTIEDGRLRTRPKNDKKGEHHPIDIFFSSLANECGENAIGIVLSGSGSDGTLGIKAINEAGGLTIAQGTDDSGPRHDGMPSSAIASGLVDLVLPVETMPPWLMDYVQRSGAIPDEPEEGWQTDQQDIEKARAAICSILVQHVGHDFSEYKSRTFMRRVWRRIQILQIASVDAYIERLRQDTEEVRTLFRDLLINVTSFFRDAPSFEAIRTLVIPRLFEHKGARDAIRVWVPGCATGEEAYSVAILLREHMDAMEGQPKVQIFATDIDEPALAVARLGRYPSPLMANVTPERLKRFFVPDGAAYVVSKALRDMCIFSSHSVIRDPPFGRIDLISCRNLMIYLSPTLQEQLIALFHYAPRPGAFLFLGTSETVTQHTNLFSPIDKKLRIFQRRDHIAVPVQFPLGVPALHLPLLNTGESRQRPTNALNLRRKIEQHVLGHFAPAHVVVNREGEIVHYSSGTGKYLEPAPGMPTGQLVSMTRRALRLEVRNALKDALDLRHSVERRNLELDVFDRVQRVNVRIEPLPDAEADPLFLVLFMDVGPTFLLEQAPPEETPAPNKDGVSVAQMERELRDTRDRLQVVIEEYETAIEELKSSNEELVSINEELQSTNEELETSQEELQSVNEELNTANSELAAKIEQVNRSSADLNNLFEGTGIAIIFLDANLLIRSFTPAMTSLFSLLETDRGRPLTDITSRIDCKNLAREMRLVLQSRQPIARHVSVPGGRPTHYLMRIMPYWSASGMTDGVLLTFVDVTLTIEAEAHQRMLVEELNHRVKNMLTIVIALATQTMERTRSPEAFFETFIGRVHAMASSYGLVSREQWGDVDLRDIILSGLEPYRVDGAERVTVAGPQVSLKSRAALALGLVIHELGTNAVKHGALLEGGGWVSVSWDVESRDGHPQLVLSWRETGGPKISESAKQGFGTELIKRQVSYELEGEAQLDYSPDGLRATLIWPVRDDVMALQSALSERT